MNWRKSSYSGGEGNCVEVADSRRRVLVRDTKNKAGAMLKFTPAVWRKFADEVKRSLPTHAEAAETRALLVHAYNGYRNLWRCALDSIGTARSLVFLAQRPALAG